MRYKRLGDSGLKVSAIGLGGNTFGRRVDEAGTAKIIHHALDLGINFIDTADVYSSGVSETFVGSALTDRRDQAVVATKVFGAMGQGPNDRGLSRKHILANVEQSLNRLQMDYIDLLQVHNWDPETPLEETMDALNSLIRDGKVRYIGCSNYAAWQMVWANCVSEQHNYEKYVSVQPRYNILDRAIERELVPACRAFGIGIIPYSPLASGLLTGKYREGVPPPEGTRAHDNPNLQKQLTSELFATVGRLTEWAQAHGHTVGELALAWLASKPEVSTVIAGATSPEQVDANVKAAEWILSPEEQAEVVALTENPQTK